MLDEISEANVPERLVYTTFIGAGFAWLIINWTRSFILCKSCDDHKWRMTLPKFTIDKESRHIILLQPLPDPFMLGLVFGYKVLDDLLELGFITNGIK